MRTCIRYAIVGQVHSNKVPLLVELFVCAIVYSSKRVKGEVLDIYLEQTCEPQHEEARVSLSLPDMSGHQGG
jgi:hypothetical protein